MARISLKETIVKEYNKSKVPGFAKNMEAKSINTFEKADQPIVAKKDMGINKKEVNTYRRHIEKGRILNSEKQGLKFKQFRKLDESLEKASMGEKNVYNHAGLEAKEFNGRECLVKKDINYNVKDSFGKTNLERMKQGKPPLIEGKPLELHHIGQNMNSPLAELTQQEHRGKGNDTILHDKCKESEINRNDFNKEKAQYWKFRAEEITMKRGA